MKTLLLILVAVLLLACSMQKDTPTPRQYYMVLLHVSTTTGALITNEVTTEFVYDNVSIDKWRQREGIYTKVDTVEHIAIIRMVTYIYPDTKGYK
jgi:hypothetical protein